MKEIIIFSSVVVSITAIVCLTFWALHMEEKAEKENFEWEKARRHVGIRRGVAEYLEAKRKWKEKGDQDE